MIGDDNVIQCGGNSAEEDRRNHEMKNEKMSPLSPLAAISIITLIGLVCVIIDYYLESE